MKKILSALIAFVGTAYGAYEFYDFFAEPDYGTKLQYGSLELYYTDNINEAKAKTLGAYLEQSDFTGGEAMSVQLDKQLGVYEFKIALLEGVATNEEYTPLFRNILNDLKKNVFSENELTLILADNAFEAQRSMPYDEAMAKPYGEMMLFNGTEVYFKGVSSDKAKALGHYLVESEFADGKERAVQLSKINDVLVFKMIVDSSIVANSEFQNMFKNFKKEIIAGAFNGEYTELHLTDEFFNTKKEFK